MDYTTNTVEYLREAYVEASKSPDPSTQVGAILVERVWHPEFTISEQIVARGYNGFPPNFPITNEILNDRKTKLFYIEHAERVCLFNAIKIRANLENCTLYTLGIPCCDCARAIGLCGITKIVVHKQRNDLTGDRWKESTNAGLFYLSSIGVNIKYFDGHIPNSPPILVNGQRWNPSDV